MVSDYGRMSKEIRKSLNITQERLSKKLGISRGYLSEIETGVKIPAVGVRIKIKTLHLEHCAFRKPKPLVEVMMPEQQRKSLIQRIMEWLRK